MSFDKENPAHLAALKSEVETDPNGYGYDPSATTLVLDIINAPRSVFVMTKSKVSAAAIRAATHFDAYDTLSIDEQEFLRWQTGSNGFEEENLPVTEDLKLQLTGNTLAQIGPGNEGQSFWSAAQRGSMVAKMLPIFEREASRAEDLFGIDTVITRNDWLAARDS